MTRRLTFVLSLCLLGTGFGTAQAQLLGDGLRAPALTNPQAQAVQAEQSAQKLSEQAQARAQQKAWGWSQVPVEPERVEAADDEEPQLRRHKRYRSHSAYRAEHQRLAAEMAQAQAQGSEAEEPAPRHSRASRRSLRHRSAAIAAPASATPTRPSIETAAPAPSTDDKPLPGEKEARQWTAR